MKILITGGAGFIGSNLADRLVARGDEVTIVDNLATGSRRNLNAINDKVMFYNTTIADYVSLKGIFEAETPEVVIHAAASYKDPDDWEEDVLTNCLGGANVAKLAKEFKVRRVIYFQTSCAYPHTSNKPITPETPLEPYINSYAATKATAEYFLQLADIDYIAFRLANVAGKSNLTGPLAAFYKKLSNNETCTVMNTRRDYIYVGDLCKVVIRAVDGEGNKGAYNISTGKDYSIKEIYDGIAKILGITKEPILQERGSDDTFTLLIDPTKTETDFVGWKADTPLQVTLEEAVKYYQENPPEHVYTHLRMKR